MTETARETGSSVSRGFVVWPTLTAIGCLFAAGWAGSYFAFFALPFFIIGLGAAIAAAIRMTKLASRGTWLRACSYAVLPCIVICVVFSPRTTLYPFARIGDRLHVLLNLSRYNAKIAQSKMAAGSRLVFFDWGGFAGNDTFLVYDESGDIEKSDSRDWGRVQDGGFAASCAGHVVHLFGHFYRCDT